jgi:RNA polymerase-binding protein DksA
MSAAKNKKSKPARKAAAKSAPKKKAAKPPARKAVTHARTVTAPRPAAPKVKAKPLSAQQLAHFREKLLAEKRHVMEEMGGLTSGTLRKSISDEAGENSRYSYHLGDVASLSYGREFSMGLAERQQNYLEQIDEALQRIEDRTYGICKVTGESIPLERLEEVPVAKYSVKGKEQLEQQRRQGLSGHRRGADAGIGEIAPAFEIEEQQPEQPSNDD